MPQAYWMLEYAIENLESAQISQINCKSSLNPSGRKSPLSNDITSRENSIAQSIHTAADNMIDYYLQLKMQPVARAVLERNHDFSREEKRLYKRKKRDEGRT